MLPETLQIALELGGGRNTETVGSLCARSGVARSLQDADQGHMIPASWPAQLAPTLNAAFGDKQGLEDQHALNGAGRFVPAYPFIECLFCGELFQEKDGVEIGGMATCECPRCGEEQKLIYRADPIAFDCKGTEVQTDETGVMPPLRSMNNDKSHANAGGHAAVAFAQNQLGEVRVGDVANTLNTNFNASGRNTAMTQYGPTVRRLMPMECARLQGFPPGHCAITYRGKPATDGPQYKAYGNSMAVSNIKWIMDRIREAMT